MSERLEIDALRALLAISHHGGVTRAADHLAISQSAVSHKIRRLEQTLNCQVLTRRAGAPLFTEAGVRLLDYARRMTELHDEALASLGKKQLAGAITLGLTEDTATTGITRILGRFTRLYPDITVRIRTSQSLTAQKRLSAGELDLAVMQVFKHDVHRDDLILFNDTLHWVKSPDLSIDPSHPVPFLSFDDACFYKQWGFTEGQAEGGQLSNVLECPSAAGIQSAVRAGLGMALLNGLHVTPDMEIIDGIFPPPPDLTFVARLGKGRGTPAVKALMEEIRTDLQSKVSLKVAS
ncbi:MAG: LysR family transcriptional regulator [Paracoccaceae bacterium]